MEPNTESCEKNDQFRLNRRKLAIRDFFKFLLVFPCIAALFFSLLLAFWGAAAYVGEAELRQLEPYTWSYTLYRSLMLMPFFLCYVIYYRGSAMINRVPANQPFNRLLCILSITSITALIAWPALSLISELTSRGRSFEGWTWLVWWSLYLVSGYLYLPGPGENSVRRRQRHIRILKPALIFAPILYLLYSVIPN